MTTDLYIQILYRVTYAYSCNIVLGITLKIILLITF